LVRGNQLAFATFEGLHFVGEVPFGSQKSSHHDHANGNAEAKEQHDGGAYVLFKHMRSKTVWRF
jgi:hypothetical protein